MRKVGNIILSSLILASGLFALNVDAACGDIRNVKSSVGTVTAMGDTKFLITIPKGTKQVTISAESDDPWQEGFGPRTVSTSSTQELVVNPTECGITHYTFEFKEEEEQTSENSSTITSETVTTTPESTEETSTTTPQETVKPTLSKLEIEGVDLEFDKDTYEYDLTVQEDVEALDIEALPEGEATVTISENAQKLVLGLNTVEITVVDSSNNSSTYTLNVMRGEKKSSNNYLGALTISGYSLNFDPAITKYTLTIKKENILGIAVTTESSKATYEINGNHNLENGSKITITVTAEDGSTKDYVINIVKKFDIMDYWMFIAAGGLLIILIILIILMKKSKKKSKEKVEPETVENVAVTAGTISSNIEIPVQNETPVVNPTEPSQLQIIEPNVDGVEQAKPEDNNSTEVFKL